MRTIEWKEGTVTTIDQTKLPTETSLLKMRECREVASAIKDMKIRGAPLIGVAAAYGLALTAYHSGVGEKSELIKEIEHSAEILKKTRPTAVNLFWAVDRVVKRARETLGSARVVAEIVVDEAEKMANEDVEANRNIGRYGAKLIDYGDTILTHCNAGKLATVDYGTALGVIRAAWEERKKIRVMATETRPKLQGARLTAYELKSDGIPVKLITDSMVGYVISKQLVNKVVVGADRIVRDAVVNKIGTYPIAVLAHEHGVPFYVAAPTSTFDLSSSAKDVIVEERSPREVTHFYLTRIAPEGIEALNPAFDVTPSKYVSAIICETGVLSIAQLQELANGSNKGFKS